MKCILCESKAQTINQSYYHCPECDLIFSNSDLIPDPDKEKKRYKSHVNNHENTGYVKMFEDFLDRAVNPYIPTLIDLTERKVRTSGEKLAPGSIKIEDEKLPEKEIATVNLRALEYGCGPGPVLADMLSWQGMEVDIFDPFFYPEKDYKEEEYDLITCTEVWEHLTTPYQVIEKLVKHLKPDGLLAVMTHFHQLGEETFSFDNWWYREDPTHITFYSQETMKWIAREFNLDLVYLGDKKLASFVKRGHR